jgi:predicted metal-dependent hydrolase
MSNAANHSSFQCCHASLPKKAREGIEFFNSGLYFECHEALEEAWRDESDSCRLLYQAILQASVALLHVKNGNTRGAQKVLLRASKKLDRLPDDCQGVPVADMCQFAQELTLTLMQGGTVGVTCFPSITLHKPGVSK